MKRCLISFAVVCVAGGAWVTAVRAASRPKLVVALLVDQFRYDYLTRFRSDYHGGFDRLLTKGAVFTNASYIHAKTVTAVGHSTYLTGATPSVSGITGNDWYDRALDRTMQSVSDSTVKTIGRPAAVAGATAASGRRTGARGASGASGVSARVLPPLSSSPRQLLVSTVGDEFKMRYPEAHIFGVSIKDRGAILPSGHMADGAYWFADDVKHWVTSTYYRDRMPQWVSDLNAQLEKRDFAGDWYPLGAKPGSAKPFCRLYAPLPGPASGAEKPKDLRNCGNIEAMPIGNELIEQFAEKLVAEENMGSHSDTDILTVSFSSNDYVGHAVGPDAPEVHDISVRTDILIGKLMDYIDSRVGAGNVIYILTADHGVAPKPEVNEARHMPGGRLVTKTLTDAATAALTARYGEGKWFTSGMEYLNLDLIDSRRLDRAEVERVAAQAMETVPHIARVYTRAELESGAVSKDPIGRSFSLAYFPQRSGELFVLPDPYWMFAATGSTHGTPYWYDAHVPVIFMGPGIKAGTYSEAVAVNDIAPTLSDILGVDTPSGSSGRILSEILDEGK
jgi:predicted AlkP superfamily pyrophosphatase or phosphodiesterase